MANKINLGRTGKKKKRSSRSNRSSHRKRSGNRKRSHNNKDFRTKSTSTHPSFGWKYIGLTSDKKIIHTYEIPDSFKQLYVKGVRKNLILNIENLHDDKKTACLKVVGELALVSAFLDRKNNNGKFTISTPSLYYIKFGDFNKVCAASDIPDKLSVTLLLPKAWENLKINGNNVEIKGSIYNKNPIFDFEDCSIVLKGQSNENATFNLKRSKFDGSSYKVKQGIVSVMLQDKSNMTCSGSLNRKNPTVFMGSQDETSSIKFYGNVTNNVSNV